MADDKPMTTLPISTEVNDIIKKLAAKKASDLKLPKLSRTDYAEMAFRELAEKESI